MDYTTVIAVAALFVSLYVAYLQYQSQKETRLSNSATMVLQLAAKFESAEYRDLRARFAETLIDSSGTIDLSLNCPVMEFFEEVAYMTRRRVLDPDMVWNSFGWWFKPYFKRISDQGALETSRQRVGHGTLFRECEWLYGQLLAIDQKERGKTVPITPDDVDRFLADESKLPR